MQETFGQRFARLRKEKGLTQEDVAQQINMTYQTISKWENDINNPDISLLPTLANILGVDVNTLLGVENNIKNNIKTTSPSFLKINIEDGDDIVNINLPISVIKICTLMGSKIPGDKNDKLSSIDFETIFKLIEEGQVGEILSINSTDGATVKIIVE